MIKGTKSAKIFEYENETRYLFFIFSFKNMEQYIDLTCMHIIAHIYHTICEGIQLKL